MLPLYKLRSKHIDLFVMPTVTCIVILRQTISKEDEVVRCQLLALYLRVYLDKVLSNFIINQSRDRDY